MVLKYKQLLFSPLGLFYLTTARCYFRTLDFDTTDEPVNYLGISFSHH